MSETLPGSWSRIRPWVTTALRLALAVVMLWSGVSKVRDLPASVRAVRAFEILPEWLAQPVGYGLPVVEIALGVLLLVGLLTRYAAVVVALLMVGFTVGIAVAWARGLSIDCGCFGGGGPIEPDLTQYPWEIVRDLALASGAAFVARWPYCYFCLDRTLGLVVTDEPA